MFEDCYFPLEVNLGDLLVNDEIHYREYYLTFYHLIFDFIWKCDKNPLALFHLTAL